MSLDSDPTQPPPRPPPPRISRHVSLSATAHSRRVPHNFSNSNLTSNHLPAYDEIIHEDSVSYQRRNSLGDERVAINAPNMRRSKSMRKKSRRKFRPQITIISSQPMAHHPAFADGSKGSCVPPEAPPSYDEATKNSVENAFTDVDYTTSNITLTSERRTISDSSTFSHYEFDSCLTSIENTNLLLPLVPHALSSSVGRHNTNQNHTDTTDAASCSSTVLPLSTEANSSTSQSTAVTYSQANQSVTSTSRILAVQSSEPSSIPPARVKPPLPRKPSLPLNGNLSFNLTSSQTSNSTNTEMTESNISNMTSLENRNKVFARQHDLPPPRPKPSIPSRNFSSTVVPPKVTDLKTDEIDPGYASFNLQPEQETCSPFEKPNSLSSRTNDVNHVEMDEKISKSLESITEESLDVNDLEVSTSLEPTYAVVQKTTSSSKKQSLQSITDLLSVDETENTPVFETDPQSATPPPIPDSRPPLEDYNGIFDQFQAASEYEEAQRLSNYDYDSNYENSSGTWGSDHNIAEEDPSDVYHEISDEKKQVIEEEDPYEVVLFADEVAKPKTPSNQRPSRNSLPPPPPPPATPTNLPRSQRLSNSIDGAKPVKKLLPAKSQSMRYNEVPVYKPSHRTADTANVIGKTKKVQRNETWSVTSNGKKVKRTPPPRPTLPLVLQKKLRNLEATRPKALGIDEAASPVHQRSLGRDVKDEIVTSQRPVAEFNGGSPRKNVPLPKPPATPTRPSLLRNLSVSDPNIPAGVSNSGSSLKPPPKGCGSLLVLSPSKRTPPPKPLGPPPVPKAKLKSAKDKNNEMCNNESLLDVIKSKAKDKESTEKPSVDLEMKNYLSGEIYCLALYDYHPTNFTDLSFSAGEKLNVLKEINDQLLFGRNADGEEGPFPRNYVTMESNSNNSNSKPIAKPRKKTIKPSKINIIGRATALYDYTSQNSDDLNFTVGNCIDVIETVGSEWLKGRIGDKAGIFPRNFVSFEPNKSSNNIKSSSKPKSTSMIAAHNFLAMYGNELSFNAGDRIQLLSEVDHEWAKGKCNGKTGLVPLSHLYSAETCYESSTEKNSLIGERPTANFSSTAVALCDFIGQDDSELSFKEHDVITITEKIDRMWLRGTLRGKTGMFPVRLVSLHHW